MHQKEDQTGEKILVDVTLIRLFVLKANYVGGGTLSSFEIDPIDLN